MKFSSPCSLVLAFSLLGACAGPARQVKVSSLVSGCPNTAGTLRSPAGVQWTREQAWRFSSSEDAERAYKLLYEKSSPWPDWFKPHETILPVGTRFQMALGEGQPIDRPGAFGTFDNVDEVADVRNGLAVKYEWKPRIDRVVTYEVTQPLPAQVGPIGPQIDSASCGLLLGRWSQLQMMIDPADRMSFIKPIAVRPIH